MCGGVGVGGGLGGWGGERGMEVVGGEVVVAYIWMFRNVKKVNFNKLVSFKQMLSSCEISSP